ncbi:MAG TPA: von Willebrand factor type A domain-containing protein [Pirellulales bacterium]|jgi:hypothetical protein|nr:von Willebrand factor type A domain-containing protein [Pirellulales bacterium]
MLSPSSPSDAWLLAQLNDVSLPDGLLARLRTIPLASDAGFDAALADVAVPSDLTDRLSAVASAPAWAPARAWLPVVKRAAAAVAMFAVGLGYLFAVTAFVYSRFEQPLLAGESLRSVFFLSSGEAGRDEAWITVAPTPGEAILHMDVDRRMAGSEPEPDEIELAEGTTVVGERIALADFAGLVAGPAGDPFSVWQAAILPDAAIGEFGAWSTERVAVRVVDSRGFNVDSWRRTPAPPWFDAARQRTTKVELVGDDASYRYCRRAIGAGRLPLAECVRVEEFLAAFDYDLADRQADTPTVSLAAAPSPYGGPLADTPLRDCSRWLVVVGVSRPVDGDERRQPDSIGAAQLTLRVMPERVKAYRIIGYGASEGAGEKSPQGITQEIGGDAIEQSVSVGRDSAMVLFEIELVDRPTSPAPLGDVQLAWRDAQGGVHATEAVLTVHSFSGEFGAAPLAWRQAALVGLAAESLAGSPFAEHVSLADVAALARKIDPLIGDRAGWRDFIEMIGKAQSLRATTKPEKFLDSPVLRL